MIKTKTLRVKLGSVLFAFLLLGLMAAFQPSTTYAAEAIGVVNYAMLVQQHPDTAKAQQTLEAMGKQAQSEFDSKSASLSDNDKRALSIKLQQGINEKGMELMVPIHNSINAAIKAVADAKGLTVVVDVNAVIYGGQDITDEVLKKITGK